MPRQLDRLEPRQEDQLGPRGNTSIAQQKLGGGYEKTLDSPLVRQQPPFVESVYDHWNLALMERGYGIAFVDGFQIGQQSVERSGRYGDFSQVEDRRLKCRRQLSRQRALADRCRRFDVNDLLLDDRWVLPRNIQSWRDEWLWRLRDEEVSCPADFREMDRVAQHVNEYVQRNFRHRWLLPGEGRTFYNSGTSGSMGNGFTID